MSPQYVNFSANVAAMLKRGPTVEEWEALLGNLDLWVKDLILGVDRERTEMHERLRAVAAREEVVAGTREPLPDDLVAWKADVARREEGLARTREDLDRRWTAVSQLEYDLHPSGLAGLHRWAEELVAWDARLRLRDGVCRHDETVLEGRRLLLAGDEKILAEWQAQLERR